MLDVYPLIIAEDFNLSFVVLCCLLKHILILGGKKLNIILKKENILSMIKIYPENNFLETFSKSIKYFCAI